MVCMRDISKGLIACLVIPEYFPSARLYTRSDRRPGAQLLVWSSLNWSVILERPYHGTSGEGSGSLSMKPVGYTP